MGYIRRAHGERVTDRALLHLQSQLSRNLESANPLSLSLCVGQRDALTKVFLA